LPSFWLPSLPTVFPFVVERVLTAIALGLIAAAVTLVVKARVAPRSAQQ
jgi:hypothetical protein